MQKNIKFIFLFQIFNVELLFRKLIINKSQNKKKYQPPENFFKQIKMIQQMIQKIYIRPIKQRYFHHDLGPKCYPFEPQTYTKKRKSYRNLSGKGLNKSNSNSPSPNKENKTLNKNVKRQDHVISSPNSQKLHVSFYRLQQSHPTTIRQFKSSKITNQSDEQNNKNLKQITLVYLHTHNGSRLQGLSLVEPILSLGVNFCTLDFSGYGNSSGNDVSLGVREVYDLQKVLQFLQQHYDQVGFILWGRSMGAVTALRYLGTGLHQQDSFNILAAIFDSPFSSLQSLTYQMASKAVNLPQSLLTPLVMIIKSTLSQKLPFQKLQLQPLMKNITVPGIFISSKNDSFISYQHTDRLYSKYQSREKQILFVERNHNQARQFSDLIKVFDFIEYFVKLNPNKQSIFINSLLKQNNFLSNKQSNMHQKRQKTSNYGSPQVLRMSKKLSVSSATINEFLFD